MTGYPTKNYKNSDWPNNPKLSTVQSTQSTADHSQTLIRHLVQREHSILIVITCSLFSPSTYSISRLTQTPCTLLYTHIDEYTCTVLKIGSRGNIMILPQEQWQHCSHHYSVSSLLVHSLLPPTPLPSPISPYLTTLILVHAGRVVHCHEHLVVSLARLDSSQPDAVILEVWCDVGNDASHV